MTNLSVTPFLKILCVCVLMLSSLTVIANAKSSNGPTQKTAGNESVNHYILLSHKQLMELKPHQRATYIRSVRDIFAEISGENSNFVLFNSVVPTRLNAIWDALNPKVFADDQEDINKIFQDMKEQLSFLRHYNETFPRTELDTRKEIIKKLLTRLSRAEGSIDPTKFQQFEKEFTETIKYSQSKSERNSDWRKMTDLLTGSFPAFSDRIRYLNKLKPRCAYAGFVIPGEGRCLPLSNSTLSGTKDEFNCNAPTVVLCNPLLFGATPKDSKAFKAFSCASLNQSIVYNSSTNEVAANNYIPNQFNPFCVEKGKDASRNCAIKSSGDKDSLCIAKYFVDNNGKDWDQLNKGISDLCVEGIVNSKNIGDITSTCHILKDRIALIPTDIFMIPENKGSENKTTQ